MIGRLSYSPDLSESLWIDKYTDRYGVSGKEIHLGFSAAINILCAVNRLIWLNYDYQWHPESLLSVNGFRSVLDFMESSAMPGVGTIGMKEYLDQQESGSVNGETPTEIFELIKDNLSQIKKSIAEVETNTPNPIGELACVLLDLKAWNALGWYYLYKLEAAFKLLEFKRGDSSKKEEAIRLLQDGLIHWKGLAEIGASHFIPYQMGRVQQYFGWSLYTNDAEQDILLAKKCRFVLNFAVYFLDKRRSTL